MRNIICQLLKKKRRIVTSIPIVQNQLEEIEYFNAYLLPLSEKANIQSALNTYGAVRLEKGDYSGVPITLTSNQKLFGHPSISSTSNITIAAGSSNVIIENLEPAPDQVLEITFQSGGTISNCLIKTMKYCDIYATNATIQNNKFINIVGAIRFDCSSSGYFRNNRIIKHQVQGTSNMIVMKGNSTTPSYGNVNLHSNYLTSTGATTDISNLQSSTFIGIDCESYGGLTRELFYAQNIGRMNIATMHGGMLYASGLGYYNIEADNLLSIFNAGNSNTQSKIAPQTNYFNTFAYTQPLRTTGTVTGFSLYSDINTNEFMYNGSIATPIAEPTEVTNFILGTQYTPWSRPVFETLPNPLGANWKSERVGKPDSTSYIQNLINTNGVADLPEGVFYISSTLNIPFGKKGIVGKGTGKTVICGLTDDFNLLTVDADEFGSFVLSNLTLQGGLAGLYITAESTFMAYQNINFIVFRDQTYGIQLHEMFGFDNNFLDNVSFVNCVKGLFQNPRIPYIPNVLEGSSYVDKTVFYKNQFINCEIGLSMVATRPNNMNAWIDCKFDGGNQAFNGGGDSVFFANCDFKNYVGQNVIDINSCSLFNVKFSNNNTIGSTLNSIYTDIEGCEFLDTSDVFTANADNNIKCNIFNSTITGNVLAGVSRQPIGLFANNNLLSNPSLSKVLVNVKGGTTTVLVDSTPTPYPQFLVTH